MLVISRDGIFAVDVEPWSLKLYLRHFLKNVSGQMKVYVDIVT